MSEPAEASQLLVLQAVRLAGVADTEAVLQRTVMADAQAEQLLATMSSAGWVEPFTFGESSGWILTEEGTGYLAQLMAAEVTGQRAAPALDMALQAFEPLNERFIQLVSRWQLRSTSPTAIGFAGAEEAQVHGLLSALHDLGTELGRCVAPLAEVLPRFGRYPMQYAAAVNRAQRDGLRWITGTGMLSCHIVWAELHQDLLASLGRGR